VSDSRVVTDDQSGPIRVAGGKRETAFSVYRDIVSQNQIAVALDPVHKNTGFQIRAVSGAISLEKRFTHKHAHEKMIEKSEDQKERKDCSR
jgi:hypothetical protein